MTFGGLLEKMLEEPKIQFESNKCLESRYSIFKCNKCRTICPNGAIDGNCLACGLCTSVCPSQAFTTSHYSEEAILNEAVKKQQITITCQNNSSLEAFTVPCLGYLSDLLLLGIVLSCGQVNIIFQSSKCADCPRKAGEVIEDRLVRVKEIANMLGKAEFSLVDSVNQEVKLSRGEFFILIRNRSKKLTEQTPEITSKNSHVFNIRKFLLNITKKHPLTVESALISANDWLVIQIQSNNRCNGCGDCVRLCPSGALTIDKKTHALVHTPISCINCGICFNSCPQNAITKTKVVDMARILKGQRVLVKKLHVSHCPRCNRVINKMEKGNGGELRLCTVCKQEGWHWLKSKKQMLNL